MKEQTNWIQFPASQYPILKGLIRTGLRWRNKEQIYFNPEKQWYLHKDPLHGEVEVYNKRGQHIAVYTPEGWPHPYKGAVKGRVLREIK